MVIGFTVDGSLLPIRNFLVAFASGLSTSAAGSACSPPPPSSAPSPASCLHGATAPRSELALYLFIPTFIIPTPALPGTLETCPAALPGPVLHGSFASSSLHRIQLYIYHMHVLPARPLPLIPCNRPSSHSFGIHSSLIGVLWSTVANVTQLIRIRIHITIAILLLPRPPPPASAPAEADGRTYPPTCLYIFTRYLVRSAPGIRRTKGSILGSVLYPCGLCCTYVLEDGLGLMRACSLDRTAGRCAYRVQVSPPVSLWPGLQTVISDFPRDRLYPVSSERDENRTGRDRTEGMPRGEIKVRLPVADDRRTSTCGSLSGRPSAQCAGGGDCTGG
ncbi:uncharacterized protein B0H18DRAFT_14212 [Fomitopsis serialis]|uniref:uncharacterized protein n=1 Tax=Fomitopsis serialis TaxID=139415 RepID=UPI002007FEA3|nr:uncharacterized protein B0H18DRAFT_14212 [Neoantrodia serialis]KAH9938407.1 hypothetical protein B0H18DRAFT_14212 [Neoantrodia serialis]